MSNVIKNGAHAPEVPHNGGRPPTPRNGSHSIFKGAKWDSLYPDEVAFCHALAHSNEPKKALGLVSSVTLKDPTGAKIVQAVELLCAQGERISPDTIADECQQQAESADTGSVSEAWLFAAEVAQGDLLTLPKGCEYRSAATEQANKTATKIARKAPTQNSQSNETEGKKSQAEALLEIALAEADIFRDADDEPFATVKTANGAHLTYRLNSTTFRSWISARHYALHGRMISSSSAFAAMLDTLRGLLIGKPAREVYTRIAHVDGRIIYDLGDESGRAVEITTNGWSICDCPSVAFIRPKGMRAQVEPQRGGSATQLWELLNVESSNDFKLILGFLVGFFQPVGAKSHLAFLGEQGTAKTATTKACRALLDPNDAPTRSEPRDIGDLIVAAKNNAIIGFDNLSHIPHWFSDFLCRLSTGSGDGKRKLYENDEEVIFAFKRSVMFNAITEVATRPDLLDRTILIELPILSSDKRRRESNLDHDFAKARPLILGAILDAVVIGLKRFDTMDIKNLPRMADFAVWVEACAPGFGWEPEDFLSIYRENRESVADSAAEISTLTSFIIELWTVKGQSDFEGTPNELLELLNRAAKPNHGSGEVTFIRDAKDWPKDAISLGRSLKRFASTLRTKGVHIRDGKTKGKRVWWINKTEAKPQKLDG